MAKQGGGLVLVSRSLIQFFARPGPLACGFLSVQTLEKAFAGTFAPMANGLRGRDPSHRLTVRRYCDLSSVAHFLEERGELTIRIACGDGLHG